MPCVWMKSAPAFTFFMRLIGLKSMGSPIGVQEAPIKNLGATSSGSPPSCLPSSRIFFRMPTSWQVSTSYTFFAPGMALELAGCAELLMVAGKAEAVLEAKRRCAEEVRLHGDPVPVAAGHLHDRLEPLLKRDDRSSDARDADDRGLAVGDVRRVAEALQQLRFLHDLMADRRSWAARALP